MPRLRRRARNPSHLMDEPRASLGRVNAPGTRRPSDSRVRRYACRTVIDGLAAGRERPRLGGPRRGLLVTCDV
jgi:hypothetical protein